MYQKKIKGRRTRSCFRVPETGNELIAFFCRPSISQNRVPLQMQKQRVR